MNLKDFNLTSGGKIAVSFASVLFVSACGAHQKGEDAPILEKPPLCPQMVIDKDNDTTEKKSTAYLLQKAQDCGTHIKHMAAIERLYGDILKPWAQRALQSNNINYYRDFVLQMNAFSGKNGHVQGAVNLVLKKFKNDGIDITTITVPVFEADLKVLLNQTYSRTNGSPDAGSLQLWNAYLDNGVPQWGISAEMAQEIIKDVLANNPVMVKAGTDKRGRPILGYKLTTIESIRAGANVKDVKLSALENQIHNSIAQAIDAYNRGEQPVIDLTLDAA